MSVFWDDKPVCNRAVASLHLKDMLSFSETADKELLAPRHSGGTEPQCFFMQSRGKPVLFAA